MKRNFLLTSFLVLLTLVSFADSRKNAALLVPIAAPTSVTASNTFQGSIKIDWVSALDPANGFTIEVTKNSTASPTLITIPAGATRTHTILSTDVTHPFSENDVLSFKVVAKAALLVDDSAPTASGNLTYIAGLKNSFDLIHHANTVTFSSVQLQWTDRNDNNEDGYEVTGSNFTTIDVPTNGQPVYTRTITGLNAKTYYDLNVRPYKIISGSKVYGSYSVGARFTTKAAPPAAPNINFTNNCPTYVGVTWTVDRPEDVETFLILRSFSGSGFDVVGIKTKGENTYYDFDARPGRRIWYRVVAINESSPNGQPSPDKFIDVTPYSAPPEPTNVKSDKAARTTTSLTITWGNPDFDNNCKSNVRTSNYVMYKLSTETEFKQFAILNAGANNVKITGLKPKDVVDFRVFSFSDQGMTSSWIGGRDTTLGPPTGPSGLKAVSTVDALGNTLTTLSWDDNARDEDVFTVQVSKDNINFTELGRRFYNLAFDQVRYIHTPVEQGVRYYYRVNAYNSFGASEYTATATHLVDYFSAPNAPYGLAAKGASGKVVLTWYDNSLKEENFVVEKSSNNGTSYAEIATLGRNVLTYTDENVLANTTYLYRVTAKNPKGSSAASNVAQYKPAATVASVLTSEGVSIYPNPTADFVNITIPAELIGRSGNILITDKNSKVILDKAYKFDSDELKLDLNKFGEGMYNVTISTGDGKVSKKVYKF